MALLREASKLERLLLQARQADERFVAHMADSLRCAQAKRSASALRRSFFHGILLAASPEFAVCRCCGVCERAGSREELGFRGSQVRHESPGRTGVSRVLVEIIRKISDGMMQRPVELRQLTRNGAGRVSGLGPTLASIGILKPSSDAGNVAPDVRLGITRRAYSIRDDDQGFHEFWNDFTDEAWATALDAPNFGTFCGGVRTLLQRISKRTHALGLKAEGYCFHFLYRKLLIGEARFRKRSTSFAAVDWHALTVGDLKYMSADQNDHLSEFESSSSAGAMSYFIFGRVDWPLLLSCFACLWHESYESDGDQSELAGSETLSEFATSWWQRNGIAPHPSVLLADYRDSLSPKAPRKSKKRAAAEMSASDI